MTDIKRERKKIVKLDGHKEGKKRRPEISSSKTAKMTDSEKKSKVGKRSG